MAGTMIGNLDCKIGDGGVMGERVEQHSASNPARAFEDLRAEVLVMRRAVEALPMALEEHQPADYSPDLARMSQGLTAVEEQLAKMQQHPFWRMTPEQYGRAIALAGYKVVHESEQKFNRAVQSLEQERQQLANLIGLVRLRYQQRRWLIYVGMGALVFGLLTSPLLFRLLPFGLDSRLAAFIMDQSRWEAGIALMKADNPHSWYSIVNDINLVSDNRQVIDACRKTAIDKKREQRCTIIVKAPRQ